MAVNKIFNKKIFITLLIISSIIISYNIINFYNIVEEKKDVCFKNLKIKLDNGTSPIDIYNKDFNNLQYYVERSLIARSEMLKVGNKLRLNKEIPLSSRDILILKEGTKKYLDLRTKLHEIANNYHCVIDAADSTLFKYNIPKELRLKSAMLSLGAAMTLYDNYFLGIVLFENDARLRKIINDPDMGFKLMADQLEDMVISSSSLVNRYRVKRVLDFVEKEKVLIENSGDDSDYAYLKLLIESSPSYNYIKNNNLKDIAKKKLITFETIIYDRFGTISDKSLDVVSGLFGNTVGLYESRKGKLYKDSVAKEHIKSKLKPLDILLEKTPFRLTDKLIPGHFGHVAIWTGTKAEIIELNLIDDEIIKPYINQISSNNNPNSKDNHQVIEALRSGVQLSTLDEFMNVDDIAILRPIFNENKSQELKRESLKMAFRQLGKSYDFNFDVYTTDKIVCSELAYISYPSIEWHTDKKLGRYCISPDNVAELAWNDLPLKLITLYHDGKLIDEDVQIEKLIDLMKE